MLLLLSPAKSLNFDPPSARLPLTQPVLKDDIAVLDAYTRKLTPRALRKLMGISETLAQLNYERFQAFDPAVDDGLQAAIAFNGDVYAGLEARSLGTAAMKWAQDRLRILSGLYGVLRPLDALQPYRLEMGVRLKTRRGPSLYDFWKKPITPLLEADARATKEAVIINLASQEYGGVVDRAALSVPLIDVAFKDEKDGELRVLGLYAKKARGRMARFAIDERIERADDLKSFNVDGYGFRPDLSAETSWVFTRIQPPPLKR
jgi:cytoplasmic iron level regulating protein YaaA (DUF328/UPF0246 family)